MGKGASLSRKEAGTVPRSVNNPGQFGHIGIIALGKASRLISSVLALKVQWSGPELNDQPAEHEDYCKIATVYR